MRLKQPTGGRASLVTKNGVTALEVDRGAQHYVVHNGVLCSVNGSYFDADTRRRCGPSEWCRWIVNPLFAGRGDADHVATAYFRENGVRMIDPRNDEGRRALTLEPGEAALEDVLDVKRVDGCVIYTGRGFMLQEVLVDGERCLTLAALDGFELTPEDTIAQGSFQFSLREEG